MVGNPRGSARRVVGPSHGLYARRGLVASGVDCVASGVAGIATQAATIVVAVMSAMMIAAM